jgi:DNA-binding HxlR family transcriptional regulator/putative sterol carrier protein
MSEHRYQQFCALARALDVVGGRWTLLIIRELRPGPRRFTDLLEGLSGVSRKLLTERLRELEDEGIIRRSDLPPPAVRQVYELTNDGRELADAMGPLIGWGARRLGRRRSGETFHPRWVSVGMVTLADRAAAEGVREIYQYVVGESTFHFIVDDGSIEVRDGQAPDASVVVTTDEATWARVASGRTKTSAAVASGAMTIAGDRAAVKRMRKIFSRQHMLSAAR